MNIVNGDPVDKKRIYYHISIYFDTNGNFENKCDDFKIFYNRDLEFLKNIRKSNLSELTDEECDLLYVFFKPFFYIVSPENIDSHCSYFDARIFIKGIEHLFYYDFHRRYNSIENFKNHCYINFLYTPYIDIVKLKKFESEDNHIEIARRKYYKDNNINIDDENTNDVNTMIENGKNRVIFEKFI